MEEVLLLNKFFFLISPTKLCDGAQMAIFWRVFASCICNEPRAARGLLKIHDAKNRHRTILSSYIFATKARIDDRKNLLNSNTSSTCPHNMTNFGLPTAQICWGTPANFNGFGVLAELLHGILVVGVSQTLRR